MSAVRLTSEVSSGSFSKAWIDLYWLPLGVGGRFVRRNGRAYEWWTARGEHRAALDLYHCGLMVHLREITYAVEVGPVWNVAAAERGVVCEGPVGTRWLGRFRPFRYEVRCWRHGTIPDVTEAVESPVRTTEDPVRVSAALRVLPDVPALTWVGTN